MIRPYQKNPSASCSPAVPSGDTSPVGDIPSYLSAQRLAELQLEGLPTTKRGIHKLAERQRWRFVDRIGAGGGRLYAVADLPADAIADLTNRRMNWVVDRARSVGRPSGTSYFELNPEVAAAVEAIITARRLSAPRVMELLRMSFVTLPSPRSLQRYIARIEREKKALIASVRNPDLFKSKHRLSLGRVDGNTTYAHEVWELDTTPADVLTIGGRKAILGLIDRFSRRANFMVAESESGQSVRRFLIETIRSWGVMPTAVMTDNGSGYINASIKSALEALGIEHRICPPGSPEKKPYVERLFGTFTRERAELLDGYAGHSVADAQELRARAKKATGRAEVVAVMTPDELQSVLTNWLDGTYHLREHGSLRMSPMRKWQSSTVPVRSAPDDNVLRLALSAMVGQRTVGKRGVQWKGGRYWSQSLAPWVGREVIVRRDEDELGELFIFAPDNSFIDIAVDHTRAGLSEEAFATLAREQQNAFMKISRADLRQKARAFDYTAARDKLLRNEAEAAGKLVHLTPATVAPSTTAIDSITAAGNAAPTPASIKAAQPAPTASTATVLQLPRSPEQKVRDADAIIARAEAGELVDEADLRRAHLYRTTSEYRATRALNDHFATQSTRDHAG